MRADGYYWVKHRSVDYFEPAQWVGGRVQCWSMIGGDSFYADEDFEAIDETPIRYSGPYFNLGKPVTFPGKTPADK
jgi:hypothetical protein